ncbi:ABC transporter transmembrane domain-containing protein [Euzebya tangerina]|uniref:ABC transporter transmembrane domain-containing protein n=1 Tax=Euzebya tangerina TaxID=591198 RepID=UPI000E323964|nr:ABC transporter transmembrane domain-containing protein [Euzebya tangerina]
MSAVLRLLWPFTRGRRVAVASGVVGTLLVIAAELARPFPLKLVVDYLAGSPEQVDGALVSTAAGLMLAVAATGALGTYASETWMRQTAEHVVHDLRVAVYRHLQRLSLRYHSGRSTGDLVARITGDANAVGELVSESIVKVLGSVLLLVGMVTVSLLLDPILTLVAVAITPILAVASVRSRRIIKRQARQQRRAEGEIAAMSTEALGAIATVKSLGTEHAETSRLDSESRARRDAGVRGSVVEGRFGGLVGVLEAVGTGTVLAIGVIRVVSGALSPGDLVVMVSYVKRLYRPLRDLARQAGRISRALARAERISEVLAADDELTDPPRGHEGPRAAGAIALEGVSFAYPGRAPTLHDVTFDAPAGSTVAVVGTSGAGKSTLAALLARFHDPSEGIVRLDGRDVRDCRLSWVREQIGFVLQDSELFRGSVADNIAYGTEATRGEVIAAARAAGADEFVTALPAGYDTPLGPGGAGLSGGQRQRLAIARTLLRDPAIVILDEPTSGLDADSEHDVIAALEHLLEGRTTVMITHSMRLAARADRVIVLEQGRVVEDGQPGRLLAQCGRFRELAVAQEVVTPQAVPAPRDERLGQLDLLLDPEAVAERLRAVTPDVRQVRIRYVRYKPGTNVVVDYDVTGRGRDRRVVLMAAADRDLAKRAARPENRQLANRVAERAGVDQPLMHLPDDDVLVQWVPLDLWLPALALPLRELATRLDLPTPDVADDPVEILAYKPRRRAVLRRGDVVFKLYADQGDFRNAARALLASPLLPVPVAPPVGLNNDLRITAQRVVPGHRLDDPWPHLEQVGRTLARVHRATVRTTARRLDPLAGARASARTVGALVPELADRAIRLSDRLAASEPTGPGAWCHGDFHRGQVLLGPSGLTVLDTDESGIGDPAMDLATFAAHLHRGQEGLERTHAALDGLVSGYGRRPAGLDWHLAVALLRRSMSPFRSNPTPDWPDRVAVMLKVAEETAP